MTAKLQIYKDSLELVKILYRAMPEMPRKDRFQIGTDIMGRSYELLDYIVHESKEKILEAIPLIREKLKNIGVTLHPKKFYIQHYSKGVEFVGSVVKPGRTYVHNRTVHNAFNAIRKFNDVTPDVDTMEQFMSVANSYLGFMKNRSTFHIRKKLIQSVSDYWWEYFTVSDDFTKVILKKQYKRIEIAKNKLKTKRRRKKYVSRGNQPKMAKNS
jgi:RNA-directed DNA polymerase